MSPCPPLISLFSPHFTSLRFSRAGDGAKSGVETPPASAPIEDTSKTAKGGKVETPPASAPIDDRTENIRTAKNVTTGIDTPPTSPMPNEERTDVPVDRTDVSKTSKKDSFLSRRKRWIKKKLLRRRRSKNEHGPERFTYEHMLLRYGEWRSVRAQVVAYVLLMMAACYHKAHGDLLFVVARLETITVGRHIGCCCDLNGVLEYSQDLSEMFGVDDISAYIILGLSGLFSLTCPLWERHIGRKNTLAAACTAGIVISICSSFTAAPWVQLTWSICFSLCTVVISLLSIATLSEILPYNIRYMAPVSYLWISGLCNAITVLQFRTKMIEKTLYLGITSAVGYAAGFITVMYWARDSIIHLVIRNKTDVVEETILRKEMRIYKERPEGDKKTHKRIAGMIFQDLVYLDRDEPKIGKFLKKLYSNWAMGEIVLAFFQSISAGAIEYEFNHFWTEHFIDIYLVNGIMIMGYVVTGLIMFALRKTHRIKALQWLLAACVFATCIRHVIVRIDKRNQCSSGHHHFMIAKYEWFAAIFGTLIVGLGSALQTTILLHFLETAPSILRPISVMMVYVPMKFTRQVCLMIFAEEGVESTRSIVPVYLYHLIIIAITMARSRTKDKLLFTQHLFDLIPQSSSASDKEDEKDAKTGGALTQPGTDPQPDKSEALPLPSVKSSKMSMGQSVKSTKATL